METLAHRELAISVRQFEAAALLLAYGYELLKSPVGQWTYEFDSLDDYLRWAAGDRNVHYREVVTWNIACSLGEPRLQAYQIMNYSSAEVRKSPEVQAAREFLKHLIRQRPRNALWIVVRNGGQPISMFGRNASIHTQEQVLNGL